MNLPHVLNAIRNEPWVVTPAMWQTVNSIVESKLAGMDPKAFWGDREEFQRETFSVIGNIGVVPIKGVIIKGASLMAKQCGACSPEDIEEDLNAVMGNPAVKHIVLHCDTPGGQVRGIPELADRIAEMRKSKNIVAYSDGLICSGGMWLAAGATAIYCTRTAEIGSIGVIAAFLDESANYAQEGYKVELFTGGKWKGEGYPGTSMSPEFRAMYQERINKIYADFTGHVSKYRKGVKPETMQGQSFVGSEAATNGLVAGIVNNIGDVFSKLQRG